MKVLVCGSRDWEDFDMIANRLSCLPAEHEQVTLLHGGARGADRIAGRAGRLLGFDVLPPFRPDYSRHPPHWAPKARNLVMLDEGPDLVLAFQVGESSGTQHTIDEARKRGIPVEVFTA